MSSVVTLRPPAAIYREEQSFAWWIYATLCALGVLSWIVLVLARGGHPGEGVVARSASLDISLFALGLGLPLLLTIGVLRMTTEVTPTDLRIWFGWVPTYRQAIFLSSVRRVEVVRYRPIADYGFWGVRRGPDGERVFHARGDRGVRLHLTDGSRILVGSQRPEELAAVIEKALPIAS